MEELTLQERLKAFRTILGSRGTEIYAQEQDRYDELMLLLSDVQEQLERSGV